MEQVDSRPSYVFPCQIYDIKMTGHYIVNERYQECHFMLMNGILMCVNEEDVIEKYQLLTIYPTIQHDAENPDLKYKICATTGGSFCPAPARLVTVFEPQEKFDNLYSWLPRP